jgi:hypothetical protein
MLIIASLNIAAYATKILHNFVAYDIHSEAHPNNARTPNATHHFEIYIRGFDLSELSIEVPEGININEGKGIEVTNQLGQSIESQVSINGRKVTLAFPEIVAAGTTLSIKLKNIHVQNSRKRIWLYHISGKMANTNQEIPLGVREIRTYR